jgi:DHA1 family multidrug resistance protein-like MFS transporter
LSTLRRLLPVYLIIIFRSLAWTLSVSGPVLPLYVRSLGVDIMEWGFLAMAQGVGLILFEGLWGTLSDRVDRRRMLLSALFGMALVFPFYTVRGFVPYFFIFQFTIGALAVAIGPTARALVADITPPESRGTYMGLWFAAFMFGNMLGPFLGTYISEVMGYEYAFYASSLILVLGSVVCAVTLKGLPRREPLEEGQRLGVLSGLKALLSIRSVALILLITVATFTGMPSIGSFLPIYASEVIGMSSVAIGGLAALSAGVQLLVNPVLGRMSDRLGQRRLMGMGLAAMALMHLSFTLVRTPLQFSLITLALSAFMAVFTLGVTMLSKAVPKELSGMAMGVYGSCEDLGFIIGPILYGLVWDAFSPSLIFLVGAGATAVAFLLLMMVREG